MQNGSVRSLLLKTLAAWDGKSVEILKRLETEHLSAPSYIPDLVALVGDPSAERGATWLLKRRFDQGDAPLAGPLRDRLFDALGGLRHWEAKLHILQCLERIGIPKARRKEAEQFVRDCLESERTLVRAWAYTGFAVLAAEHPAYREEALGVLTEGETKESAGSIRVRLREARRMLADAGRL